MDCDCRPGHTCQACWVEMEKNWEGELEEP